MSVKTRICIICKKPAKSGEHVFPAALGGRRTNNGIYCGIHNNKFGTYVAELERNLRMMNALLEIRQDRRESAKPFPFESSGETYRLLGAEIELTGTSTPEYPTEEGRSSYKFASNEEKDAWIKNNPNNDLGLKVESYREEKEYQLEAFPIRLSFGSPDTMYAVIYLALTFIADNYPGLARARTLITFKRKIVQRILSNKIKRVHHDWLSSVVSWDGRDSELVIGANPFNFGHAVAMSINAETGQISCYVSFYSCLKFVVDFGCHEVAKSDAFKSKTIFIDPEADSAKGGKDRHVVESVEGHILDGVISLKTMISDGYAQEQIKSFFEKVSKKREVEFQTDFSERLSSFISDSNPSSRDIANFFVSFFSEESQLIVNKIIHLSESEAPIVRSFLGCLIKKGDFHGVSRDFSLFVKGMELLFADAATRYFFASNRDMSSFVYDLLYGRAGNQIITSFIFQSYSRSHANPQHP